MAFWATTYCDKTEAETHFKEAVKKYGKDNVSLAKEQGSIEDISSEVVFHIFWSIYKRWLGWSYDKTTANFWHQVSLVESYLAVPIDDCSGLK